MMQRTIRKHLKKKQEKLKIQQELNQTQFSDNTIEEVTEYADDSSDNIYNNDDEKREYEEKELYAPYDIDHPSSNTNYNNNMLNYDLSCYQLSPHPLDNTSCCSRLWQNMTSSWVLPLIKLGHKRPLKVNDLYSLPKTESVSHALGKWNNAIHKYLHKCSVLRIIWDIEKSDVIFVFMLNLIRALIIVGLLYLWQFLIAFYTDPDVPITSGILLGIYMLILNLCRSIINSMITNTCSSMGTRMMGMIMSVMYDKGLEMDLESSKKQAALNIIGSNLEYIGWGLLYLPSSMIFAIILIIVSFAFLYLIVGSAALAGIAFVLFLGIPAQAYVLYSISWADDHRFEVSDERVSFMNDLFHGIRFTKLYSWEIPLMQRIAQYRKKERVYVRSYNHNLAWLRLINYAIPTLMLVVIVIVYLSIGHELHLFVMFQLIIVAEILAGAVDMIPVHALFATEFIMALERVDEFLLIENKATMKSDTFTNIQRYMEEDIAICIKNASFEWKDGDKPEDDKYKLNSINMEIKRGSLIAIIGCVGSGKSSLLHAILGEMVMLGGTHYVNGAKNGNKSNVISYVPQQTFILNGSVRDNILLGLPFDGDKYRDAIAFSALQQDLHILPQGDATEIGEQGVTISGGQKMRISFARALYRCYDSDLFLLDDPLSSVDIDVGQIMFKKGIQKLLKSKTRIVVMNSHLFYLKYFDEIYVMDHGTIAAKASYHELMNNYQQFAHLMPSNIGDDDDDMDMDMDMDMDEKEIEKQEPEPEAETVIQKQEKNVIVSEKQHVQVQNKLKIQKEFETGTVPFNVYREFFWSAIREFDAESTWLKNDKYHTEQESNNKHDCRHIVWMIISLIILIVAQVCDPLADLILIIWADSDSEGEEESLHSSTWWITVWCCVILLIAVLRLISGLCMSRWLLRAAFNLMMKTLYYTLRAPMVYYDVTPKSSILNRFTKDTNIIDIDIPFDLDIFSSQLLIAISYIMIVCVCIPSMIIILVMVSPIFYYLISKYRRTYIELVRLCVFGLDPITSIFSETLIGLASIRSYKLQRYFKQIMNDRITMFINLWYVRNSVYSWFDLSLDLLIDVIVMTATILGFYARDSFTSPALVAFAIVYLNIISGHLQVAMLQLVWLESEFGAVQRLLWYHPAQNNVIYEANPINPDYIAPDNWPTHGNICIKNLKLQYRKKLHCVLDIDYISIRGGEKIGICGRTGAGKSSLMVALFRLVEAQAGCCIIIDGIECTKLGLYHLRNNITIIPQDPILFMGTLRFNLDPFNQYSDDKIWHVLRKCHLHKVIKTRKNDLKCIVLENGANFSQGEKQLICIARALLKETKLLLLDEATSSIDKDTDMKIQTLIRKHFKNTTVLCIAHRLETILDYDRILVLHQGKIAQFDTPHKLMKQKNGLFAKMINTVKRHHHEQTL